MEAGHKREEQNGPESVHRGPWAAGAEAGSSWTQGPPELMVKIFEWSNLANPRGRRIEPGQGAMVKAILSRLGWGVFLALLVPAMQEDAVASSGQICPGGQCSGHGAQGEMGGLSVAYRLYTVYRQGC